MYDVVIIGAGVIGTFIARELSKYELKIVLLEKANDVSDGTTKANSAIIHAGYDAKEGTLKAKLNAMGNPMFDKVCKELDVPFKRIGSLVIATNEKEMVVLKDLLERGKYNNILDMKLLNQEEVLQKEPNLSKEVIGALYAKTAGITSPFELAIALAENAIDNGVELMHNQEVTNIQNEYNTFFVQTQDKVIKSRYVINCAGVYADKVNNMINSPSFSIIPRRGQYFVFDKQEGKKFNSVIFQCPTEKGKGILITKTVHGNLLVGPDSQDIENKEAIETTKDRLDYVRKISKKTSTNVNFSKVITSFAGLRATPSTGDFIIGESETANFINAAGIESPGLSASPAIAQRVVKIILEKEDLTEKENYIKERKRQIRFIELSNEEKRDLIEKDNRYGKIICRCEQITEGEIIDVIHRNAGAKTVDGVKRRVRPGMGVCQGGFCGPRVLEILARELNKSEIDILKDSKYSYILTGTTKDNNLYEA